MCPHMSSQMELYDFAERFFVVLKHQAVQLFGESPVFDIMFLRRNGLFMDIMLAYWDLIDPTTVVYGQFYGLIVTFVVGCLQTLGYCQQEKFWSGLHGFSNRGVQFVMDVEQMLHWANLQFIENCRDITFPHKGLAELQLVTVRDGSRYRYTEEEALRLIFLRKFLEN